MLIQIDSNQDILVDVSVTDPTAASHVQAAQDYQGAASKRENTKINSYKDLMPRHIKFHPLVVETFGTLGPKSNELLKTLAGALAKNSPLAAARRQGSTSILRELREAVAAGIIMGTDAFVRSYWNRTSKFMRVNGSVQHKELCF